MHCPQGASLTGEQAIISAFDPGRRLSSTGRLHFRSYSYTSGPDPVGHSELELQVHGATATGSIEVVTQVFVNDVPVDCHSGRITFTAKRH